MLLSKSLVSFPGFGIGEFELDNVAIAFDSFEVYWYGVIITLGMVTAFLYVVFRGKYESVSFDSILDIGIWTIVVGVIGARLYYVLTTLDHFIPDPFNFFEFIGNVFNLRSGGLAIYGGIIAGALAILVVTKIKKINTLKLLDMAAPGVMIAQAMGRWGNFFNGEAFGGILTEEHPLYFMRMGLISGNTRLDFATSDMVYVHPTFLYESLWNVIGFILINIFYKKKKFNGQVACMYLAWYGIGRFFIEGLRTDSLYIPGTEIRISQLVGILCFVVFGALLVWGLIYSRKYKDESVSLNKFDKLLKPGLVTPVFFAKKAAVVADGSQEIADQKIIQGQEKEDSEDGTDN
ncbi:MAG: prolipoprotein diacylglyceryl transferase [Ruminococcaceae bacterium]|nr:prolipoprotein diacylglyceryl transferase [Oscillospiraceae bacterium]